MTMDICTITAYSASSSADEAGDGQEETMTLRCALYARYSSDQQRTASIEDQFRICRGHAEREGWRIENHVSGRGDLGRERHPAP